MRARNANNDMYGDGIIEKHNLAILYKYSAGRGAIPETLKIFE